MQTAIKWTHNPERDIHHAIFDIGEATIVYDHGLNNYAYTVRFNRASFVRGNAKTVRHAQEKVEYAVRIW